MPHRLLRPLFTGLLVMSVAQTVSAAPVMPNVVLRTLPNGLRLLIRQQRSAPLVAVDVWVRAGSGRERAGDSGAAHFLEHLLFKGTATRKPGEIDGAIEDLGATLSAFTLREAAHFCTTVPSAQAQTAVEVIADALQHSQLQPDEVERERAVILDELARARNDVGKDASNRAFAALYPGHAYANPVLGTPAAIRSLSRDAVFEFYHRWYTPANTIVVIVGDIAADRADEMVKAAFGSWTGTAPQPRAAPVHTDLLPASKPKLDAATSVGVPASSQLAATAFRVDAAQPASEAAAGFVAAALLSDRLVSARAGGGPDSGNAPVAPAELTGEYTVLPGGSMLLLTGIVPAGKANDFRQTIDSEIGRLAREAPTAAELDAARRRVIGPYLYDIETYGGQASALGRYDVLGDYAIAQSLVDALLALKPADITAFAQKRLTAEIRADIILNPPSHP